MSLLEQWSQSRQARQATLTQLLNASRQSRQAFRQEWQQKCQAERQQRQLDQAKRAATVQASQEGWQQQRLEQQEQRLQTAFEQQQQRIEAQLDLQSVMQEKLQTLGVERLTRTVELLQELESATRQRLQQVWGDGATISASVFSGSVFNDSFSTAQGYWQEPPSPVNPSEGPSGGGSSPEPETMPEAGIWGAAQVGEVNLWGDPGIVNFSAGFNSEVPPPASPAPEWGMDLDPQILIETYISQYLSLLQETNPEISLLQVIADRERIKDLLATGATDLGMDPGTILAVLRQMVADQVPM